MNLLLFCVKGRFWEKKKNQNNNDNNSNNNKDYTRFKVSITSPYRDLIIISFPQEVIFSKAIILTVLDLDTVFTASRQSTVTVVMEMILCTFSTLCECEMLTQKYPLNCTFINFEKWQNVWTFLNSSFWQDCTNWMRGARWLGKMQGRELFVQA